MAGSLTLFRNQPLRLDRSAELSTVCEPSLSNNGRNVFFAGNWFAAYSADHGNRWTHLDPNTFLQTTAGGFCCDQTIHYNIGRDLTIWVLQYRTAGTSNTLRLAVCRGTVDRPLAWYLHDIVPSQIDPAWDGEWFDYNHVAFSRNYLYVGSNLFGVEKVNGVIPWKRCAILRIPLSELDVDHPAGHRLAMNTFSTTEVGPLRCTQGAGNVMYFAAHSGNDTLRVFEWPENSTVVTPYDVPVTPWADGRLDAAELPGTLWMSRCDPRITGAWVADGVMGFMWTANAQPGRKFPFVRVVRIDTATKRRLNEPDIWSSKVPYCYPDASPNLTGKVGITLFTANEGGHPAHLVGILNDTNDAWDLQLTAESDNTPEDLVWGDYLTCRTHNPDGLTWIASGYVLRGGDKRKDIEPRFIHFGLDEHHPAIDRFGLS